MDEEDKRAVYQHMGLDPDTHNPAVDNAIIGAMAYIEGFVECVPDYLREGGRLKPKVLVSLSFVTTSFVVHPSGQVVTRSGVHAVTYTELLTNMLADFLYLSDDDPNKK